MIFSILAGAPDAFGKGQSLPFVMSKQYGYGLQQSREGIPVLVSKMFWNFKDVAQNITVVFDIRKDDISMYVVLQEEVAHPMSTTSVSVSWTPQIAGEYQIRSFAVSNLTSPEVLEDVAASKFNVMSNDDFVALYADRPASFPIVSVDPIATSPSKLRIKLSEKQNLGSGLITGIGDIAISDNGLYLTGITEVPPIGESFPFDTHNLRVYFMSSNDRGLTFEPMQYLGNNTRGLTFVHHPIVHAVNDTLVYTAWHQKAHHTDEFRLVLSKSLDGGRTFDKRTNFDRGGVVSGDLDLAFSNDGRSLYIVLTEVSHYYPEPLRSAIVFSKSNDYGQTFTPKQAILNYTGYEWINCLQIATQEVPDNSSDTDNVYLAWRQDSDDHRVRIMFSASHDSGVSFSNPIVVSDAYTDYNDCPWLAAYGDDVYLSWAEMKLIYKPEDPSEILVGDTDTFFVASRDRGRSFEPPVNLSEGIGAFTSEPVILVSDGRIYAVWRDTIPEVGDDGGVSFYGNAEVLMTRSLDGGRTFEKPLNLSNNPTGSYAPKIAVHANNVYIIWMESTFPSNEAVVSLRISGDGGKTFGEMAENIVGSIPGPVSRAKVLTSPDGEQIYILWSQVTGDEGKMFLYALVGDAALESP